MLCESQRRGYLPFEWDSGEEEWEFNNLTHTNAYHNLELSVEEYRRFLEESQFGPPFTIGLECIVAQDWQSLAVSEQADSTETNSICQRAGKKGARLNIKLSHPSKTYEYEPSFAAMSHLVELTIDGKHTIRFLKAKDYQRDGRIAGSRQGSTNFRWRLEVSSSLIPSSATDSGMVPVARFRMKGNEPVDLVVVRKGARGFDAEALLKEAITGVSETIGLALDGCFFIGAVRRPTLEKQLSEVDAVRALSDEGKFKRDPVAERCVGFEGEYSWYLERHFAYNAMTQWTTPPEKSSESFENKYQFEGYVSYWLSSLVGTKIVIPEGNFSLQDKIVESGIVPSGTLCSTQPAPIHPIENEIFTPEDHPSWDNDGGFESLSRLRNACLGVTEGHAQPPSQMSAGFHQLFPFVVQTGLMMRRELLAVENPEVHLHPSLQLEVTEFFLRQAAAGKIIIIETHSDLIVRRVIREILEESIGLGQEAIRLYFTDTAEEFNGFHYSRLTPLSVDDHGRIANWPEGFMDDDVKESRRLLDAMYGSKDNEHQDDHD